ncbi:MAG: alpha/beta fold hydrolase [Oscillochloris sp.]|nr:alpha/beta fold hydrolase [Oscillochloris sp.]
MPLIETPVGQIFYAAHGEHGPALICLHGAGGSHTHWGRLMSDLGDVVRAFAPDLPGHGRSAPPGRASISDYVEFLFAYMDALGIAQAWLAGHSLGGAIALSATLARPQRVAGLALIGTSARLRVLPSLISGLAEAPEPTIAQLVDLLYAGEAPQELRSAAVADYRRCDPLVFRDDFIACDGFDIRPRLAEIQLPVTVIAGTEDRLVPAKLAAEIQAGIAGAELISLPGTGHMPMLERPTEVAVALRPRFV